jgi:protein subunit release factor B
MNRELLFSVTLDDCTVQTFRAGGNGGQNQNKRDTGVRVIHNESGARAEAREERSQLQNKRAAFIRMSKTGTFKMWLNHKLADKPAEQRVAEDMDPKNLLVEVRGPSGWEESTIG